MPRASVSPFADMAHPLSTLPLQLTVAVGVKWKCEGPCLPNVVYVSFPCVARTNALKSSAHPGLRGLIWPGMQPLSRPTDSTQS